MLKSNHVLALLATLPALLPLATATHPLTGAPHPVPSGATESTLLVLEGPIQAAALDERLFKAEGRPNATSGPGWYEIVLRVGDAKTSYQQHFPEGTTMPPSFATPATILPEQTVISRVTLTARYDARQFECQAKLQGTCYVTSPLRLSADDTRDWLACGTQHASCGATAELIAKIEFSAATSLGSASPPPTYVRLPYAGQFVAALLQ